jgi:hypothetical protein
MLGRKMPAAASRRGNARKATCRTLSLIFGAPQSVGRTLLQRGGMTAVGWHALGDEARSFDPTSLGGRSSTPQRVNRLRGTIGQEHSGHGAMFITRAAAHQSRWVLDSSGSSTRNTEAPRPGSCVGGGVTPTTQSCPHPIGAGLPPTGRTLKVGEQKRHHPRSPARPHARASRAENQDSAAVRVSGVPICSQSPSWTRPNRRLVACARS